MTWDTKKSFLWSWRSYEVTVLVMVRSNDLQFVLSIEMSNTEVITFNLISSHDMGYESHFCGHGSHLRSHFRSWCGQITSNLSKTLKGRILNSFDMSLDMVWFFFLQNIRSKTQELIKFRCSAEILNCLSLKMSLKV